MSVLAQFTLENGDVMDVRCALRVWRSVGERSDELFRRAFASDLFFKIGQAFDVKQWGDVGQVKIVHQHSLIEAETFERRLVEDQAWSARHS